MNRSRAAIGVAFLLGLGLLAVAGYGAKRMGLFSGETKRAKASADTTEELVASTNQQSANAAASVTKIVEVAGSLDPSWQRDFMTMEGSLALGFLQKPDPMALARAEARRRAVAEGERDEARRLYGMEAERAQDAEKRAQRAITAKRASDMALEEAAAEARGAESDRFLMLCVAGAIGALWIWTKLTHASPLALSRVAQDIRSKTEEPDAAIRALDGALTPFQQGNVALMHWFREKLKKATT